LPQASVVAMAASHTLAFLVNYWLLHPWSRSLSNRICLTCWVC
jgi:hypothetical protein